MASIDVDMSDVAPEGPFLPYGVPHPPKLDDMQRLRDASNNMRESLEPVNWDRDALYHGARDDPLGEGFEVRLLNFNDQTGKMKGLPDDWDVQYILGPPNPSKEIKWDDPIQKWGLQVLDKAGFINYGLDNTDSLGDPIGRFAKRRNPANSEQYRIHPVFRQDCWQAITDVEYDIIRPALLLASALLDEPSTLCLFHAMAAQPSEMIAFEDPVLKTCRRLRVPETLTYNEELIAFRKISSMREYTSFVWDPSGTTLRNRNALACTIPRVQDDGKFIPAEHPHTRRSTIVLNKKFFHALHIYSQENIHDHYETIFKATLDLAGVPETHRPSTRGVESAQLRSALLFAVHLMHEFAHAFFMAHYPWPGDSLPPEPWLGDNRNNELGHAMIIHLFGDVVNCPKFRFKDEAGDPKLLIQDAYTFWGLCMSPKWRQWTSSGAHKDFSSLQAGEVEDRSTPFISYPIHQKEVFNAFSRRMWEEWVPRFGLEIFKFSRIPEWASNRYPGPDPADPWKDMSLR
ncbi:hypothetical protein E4T49_01877 [Aureobasidium sp. EXF-10728]|nr:hypothetical protein E4T49_01877 [Aureobasidium sp. EXF-10728]